MKARLTPHRSRPLLFTALLLWLCGCPVGRNAMAQPAPISVEPSELARRKDLVGQVITVDDRVKFYQAPAGKDHVELSLKRTPVVFRVPSSLRPPRPTPVVVTGRLLNQDGQLVCEVSSLTTYPTDLDRLERGVAALGAKDFENRKAWAQWAQRRARDFGEDSKPLGRRAEALVAEAIRIEAEMKRATVDAPGEWLALAEEARRKNVPEPDPSALAHRAFRARLATARTSHATREVIAPLERFFPRAAKEPDAARANVARWEDAYMLEPAFGYRSAPANARAALDRRLWADAQQQLLEQLASEDPQSAVQLSQQAETLIPERSKLSTDLLNKGLSQGRSQINNLRLAEVRQMGQAYREKLQNPAAALELYRDWLKVQRERLSETDAEGPVALAGLFEELLQDRAAAFEMLQRAWKIDPGSSEVAEAFRARGYKRVKDEWIEEIPLSGQAGKEQPGNPGTSISPPTSQSLRGKTPDEVKELIGLKPNRKTYSGSKGQLVEQWIFVIDARQLRFVNFLHTPGELKPRVVADYFLPREKVKGDLSAAH